MGISNDISRRRSSAASHKHSHDSGGIFNDDFEIPKPDKKDGDTETVKISTTDQAKTDFFDHHEPKQNDFFPETPKPTKPKKVSKEKSPKKYRGKTLLILITIALVLIGASFLGSIKKIFSDKSTTNTGSSVEIIPQDYTPSSTSTTTTPTTTPDTTATTAPAATTTPVVTTPTYTKSSVKIEILNGNGVKKAADVTKATLISAGFNVAKTGNAANFNYTATTVYYKTGNNLAAADIATALASKTPTTKNDDKICTTYDIVIILGK